MIGHLFLFIALITSYVFYYLFGSLYPGSGLGLTSASMFFYLLLSGVYLLFALPLTHKNIFVKLWIVFMLLNFVSFILISEHNLVYVNRYGFSEFTIIKTIMVVSLSFFPFYFLARKKVIGDSAMRNVFFILMIVSTIGYFVDGLFVRNAFGEGSQVNAIYGLVYLLPFIIFIKRKFLFYTIFIILFLLVLSSFKRGAVITYSLGSIILLYGTTKSISKRSRKLSIIF